jgi:hypothetical protein
MADNNDTIDTPEMAVTEVKGEIKKEEEMKEEVKKDELPYAYEDKPAGSGAETEKEPVEKAKTETDDENEGDDTAPENTTLRKELDDETPKTFPQVVSKFNCSYYLLICEGSDVASCVVRRPGKDIAETAAETCNRRR